MDSLKFIEVKYKVKPSVVLLVLFLLLLLLSPILNTRNILTSIVCYLIPAYLSFIALESTDKEDDIRYLIYWIVFSLVEVSTPLFRLFFNKFIYMTIQVLITVILLHPLSNIASIFYNNFIGPFLNHH
jgi:receptor expression-enhancing protein 5/6